MYKNRQKEISQIQAAMEYLRDRIDGILSLELKDVKCIHPSSLKSIEHLNDLQVALDNIDRAIDKLDNVERLIN